MGKVIVFAVDLDDKKVMYNDSEMPKDLEVAFDLIDSELHIEQETSKVLLNEVSRLESEVNDLKEQLVLNKDYFSPKEHMSFQDVI
jgi:hypothetical protein